ncbi:MULTISPECIES: DUF6153 family protein [Microbacterium]|uniref:DUF2946 domain-containing protein n=1 Tax=Microbacterium flavum TaxID=415216 RepID=A0ABS5XTL7_9MICO|nr:MULTISPECIES: DUF6153 family protein [Microbacterium]MBT8797878.1 hypothetical protein [Microbacterium flavum]MCX6503239.1 DUF6153 family protein [Microbacterium sp.]
MIALAQHLRRSPYGLGRSVLLLIALTAALIIGLLAMHAMSSVTSHTTPAVTAVSMHEMDTAHGDAIQPVEEGCADCGGHEAMLAMACVLALLVVSVLFLLPRTGLTWVAPLRRAGPLMVAGRGALSRPPSLLVLCVSRT